VVASRSLSPHRALLTALSSPHPPQSVPPPPFSVWMSVVLPYDSQTQTHTRTTTHTHTQMHAHTPHTHTHTHTNTCTQVFENTDQEYRSVWAANRAGPARIESPLPNTLHTLRGMSVSMSVPVPVPVPVPVSVCVCGTACLCVYTHMRRACVHTYSDTPYIHAWGEHVKRRNTNKHRRATALICSL
jgi:hypothetical protein